MENSEHKDNNNPHVEEGEKDEEDKEEQEEEEEEEEKEDEFDETFLGSQIDADMQGILAT
jgi:hypothetical protein